MTDETELVDGIDAVAWDYHYRHLMGAPGETRHHIYWVSDYVGRETGKVTGDLQWLLDRCRVGLPNVQAPIWVRPMYYGEDVKRLILAERERCAKIVDDMVRAVDGADAIAAIRKG